MSVMSLFKIFRNQSLRLIVRKESNLTSTNTNEIVKVTTTKKIPPWFRKGRALKIAEGIESKTYEHVPSFNIAAYVDESPTLQELVNLGVDLHKIETTKGAAEIVLRLDFERDIKNYIRFLHDVGVPVDDLGKYFSKNPFIFKQDLENLAIRINYLESKEFTKDNIVRIITNNPKWLNYSTMDIDEKLGFCQNLFSLEAEEVRTVATVRPKLITERRINIENCHFAVVEQMGFTKHETKTLVLTAPKLFTSSKPQLLERFDYIHSEMGINHSQLVKQPKILLVRKHRLNERHQFLKSLNKAIYNPNEPGYVSLNTFSFTDDQSFCDEVAKVPIALYNLFLKSL